MLPESGCRAMLDVIGYCFRPRRDENDRQGRGSCDGLCFDGLPGPPVIGRLHYRSATLPIGAAKPPLAYSDGRSPLHRSPPFCAARLLAGLGMTGSLMLRSFLRKPLAKKNLCLCV